MLGLMTSLGFNFQSIFFLYSNTYSYTFCIELFFPLWTGHLAMECFVGKGVKQYDLVPDLEDMVHSDIEASAPNVQQSSEKRHKKKKKKVSVTLLLLYYCSYCRV